MKPGCAADACDGICHRCTPGDQDRTLQGADILVTAIEGGIGYWARTDAYAPDSGTATITDTHTGESFALSADALLQAADALLQAARARLLPPPPDDEILDAVARSIARADIDAEAADVIVQVAVFGLVIYA
jgi:hypothetical protein